MRSKIILWCVSAVCFTLLALFFAAPPVQAQGGEPQYFAIRGAKVVPVSGPPVENATIVVSRGLITAVGKDIAIPPEAWVVEGKGLTVYPGLIDSLTDVGLPVAAPASGEGGPRRPASEGARGPEDRPYSTPWRSAADEASLSDKRIETWRSGGFTTVVSSPKGGIFPGQAAVLDLAGERAGDVVVNRRWRFRCRSRPREDSAAAFRARSWARWHTFTRSGWTQSGASKRRQRTKRIPAAWRGPAMTVPKQRFPRPWKITRWF